MDNLRRIQVKRETQVPAAHPPDASTTLGEYVEPVHLQVVCRRLYRVLDLEHDLSKSEINAGDVARLGDVNKALGEYYAGEVSEIAIQTGAMLSVIWEYRVRLGRTVAGITHDPVAQRFARFEY